MKRFLSIMLLLSAGCVQKQAFQEPAPERIWPETLRVAQVEIARGRFAAADSALASFMERYPESAQAADAMYWRGVFTLDPANPATAPREARELFDRYLASTGASQHVVEARALRRIALLADSISALGAHLDSTRVIVSVTPVPESAVPDARDAEIERLREELKRTTDELERIKRRLTAPKP